MLYKRENKYFIYRFILVQVFPIIILINVQNNNWIVFSFWLITLLLFVFYEFYTKKLFAIRIQDNEIEFHFFQFFFKKKTLHNFNELTYSYNNEVGAKGIKSLEFRIYKNYTIIIKGVGRGLDGWTDETIDSIIEEFKMLGIKENKYGNK